MTSTVSDWEALAALTDRLDELRGRLDMAEANNQIAAIYALEEVIAETEAERERLFSRIQDRAGRILAQRAHRINCSFAPARASHAPVAVSG